MFLVPSVRLSVCLGVPRAHYTPLQRYMGYLCTRKAQYAPLRRNMHHGAQGRLCFLKNSGDPDDFLFWWFTENTHKMCVSGKCPCGSHWHTRHTRPSRCCPLHIVHRAQHELKVHNERPYSLCGMLGSHVFEWVTWLIYRFTSIWTGHTVTIIFGFTMNFCTYMYLNGSHGWFIGSQVFEWVTLLQLFLGSQVFFIRMKNWWRRRCPHTVASST